MRTKPRPPAGPWPRQGRGHYEGYGGGIRTTRRGSGTGVEAWNGAGTRGRSLATTRASRDRDRALDFVPLHLPLPLTPSATEEEEEGRRGYRHLRDSREVLGLEAALAVVDRLHRKGHEALFAGGWVRDRLLLDGKGEQATGARVGPSAAGLCETSVDGSEALLSPRVPLSFLDVDVATSASDQDVLGIFPHTSHFTDNRIKTVVVVDDTRGGTNTEVTCFRGRDPKSPKQDAELRDFTCNALFYDVVREEVRDYLGGEGISDCVARRLRCVGRPQDRFREDPCRLMRAVRLAATLDFAIEPRTLEAIRSEECQGWLEDVSKERLFIEVVKGSKSNRAWAKSLRLLSSTGLAGHVFPEISPEDFERAAEVAHEVALLLAGAELPGQIGFEDSGLVTGVRLGALLPAEASDFQDYKDLGMRAGCPKRYKKDILCMRLLADLEARTGGSDWRAVSPGELNSLLEFYANEPNVVGSCLCFYSRMVSLSRSPGEGADFLERHAAQRRGMERAIRMKRANERTLTSRDLEAEGIAPGPEMGRLLGVAQALSAQENIFDAGALLERLKASEHWATTP
ncbi:tRNA-nucleotidyltransferase [Chloropicon primus]|nr:tRNA-nucleotidyltransferase [Chloropicon primus]